MKPDQHPHAPTAKPLAGLTGSELGSRALDRMTDATNARRLLLMWVWSGRWTVLTCPWGFRLGPLWVQWTPPTIDESLNRALARIPDTNVSHRGGERKE